MDVGFLSFFNDFVFCTISDALVQFAFDLIEKRKEKK